ncbi:MAG: hypothetical protein JSW11_17810 [Candidatus Heimdallarchaeota archaeon]|nr:MAG: hypothetical protein JSW11_17810 [Candidatus Heimdallarchaeota archaeon]
MVTEGFLNKNPFFQKITDPITAIRARPINKRAIIRFTQLKEGVRENGLEITI